MMKLVDDLLDTLFKASENEELLAQKENLLVLDDRLNHPRQGCSF